MSAAANDLCYVVASLFVFGPIGVAIWVLAPTMAPDDDDTPPPPAARAMDTSDEYPVRHVS